jgi:hypothetical protein
MKPETIKLLEKFHTSKRFEFSEAPEGLSLDHDLTDAEKLELVEAEYGKTLSAPVDKLFVAIMKKLIQSAIEKAKADFPDRLSEL